MTLNQVNHYDFKSRLFIMTLNQAFIPIRNLHQFMSLERSSK